MSTTSFFLKALRLLKTAFPLPPHKKGGREKAKPEFWKFVMETSWNKPNGRNVRPSLNFCDSRFLAGAKVALQGWP